MMREKQTILPEHALSLPKARTRRPTLVGEVGDVAESMSPVFTNIAAAQPLSLASHNGASILDPLETHRAQHHKLQDSHIRCEIEQKSHRVCKILRVAHVILDDDQHASSIFDFAHVCH